MKPAPGMPEKKYVTMAKGPPEGSNYIGMFTRIPENKNATVFINSFHYEIGFGINELRGKLRTRCA